VAQAEEKEEVQALTQEGLELYEALIGYNVRNPRFIVWLLHSTADDLREAIINANNLTDRIYMIMGRIDMAQELLWQVDHHRTVSDILALPEVTRSLLITLARMFKAYNILTAYKKDDDDLDRIYLENILEEAMNRLHIALKKIIDYASNKLESQNCQNASQETQS